MIEQTAVGRLATARLRAPSGSVVDLLFGSSGVEREIVESAVTLTLLEGLRVGVASKALLIATKVLARDDRSRPQDRVDLAALLAIADDTVIADARAALRLITTRGYSRGRDLDAALDRALAELGPKGPTRRS